VGGELALYGEVPLVGLGIAVIRIDALVETSAAVLDSGSGRGCVGELDERRASGCKYVGVGMQRRGGIAAVVERERSEIGDGEDAKSSAHYGLGVVERTPCDRDAGLEVALVDIAQRLG
jgi:hypothetical protein